MSTNLKGVPRREISKLHSFLSKIANSKVSKLSTFAFRSRVRNLEFRNSLKLSLFEKFISGRIEFEFEIARNDWRHCSVKSDA